MKPLALFSLIALILMTSRTANANQLLSVCSDNSTSSNDIKIAQAFLCLEANKLELYWIKAHGQLPKRLQATLHQEYASDSKSVSRLYQEVSEKIIEQISEFHADKLDVSASLSKMGFTTDESISEIGKGNLLFAFNFLDARTLPAGLNSDRDNKYLPMFTQITTNQDLESGSAFYSIGNDPFLGINQDKLEKYRELDYDFMNISYRSIVSKPFSIILHEYGHALDHFFGLSSKAKWFSFKNAKKLYSAQGDHWQTIFESSDLVSFYALETTYDDQQFRFTEDFAESFVAYLFDPYLKCYAPKKYDLFASKIKVNALIYGSNTPWNDVNCLDTHSQDILKMRTTSIIDYINYSSKFKLENIKHPLIIDGKKLN